MKPTAAKGMRQYPTVLTISSNELYYCLFTLCCL